MFLNFKEYIISLEIFIGVTVNQHSAVKTLNDLYSTFETLARYIKGACYRKKPNTTLKFLKFESSYFDFIRTRVLKK